MPTPFLRLTGVAASLPSPNLDTDTIMPKRFLKVTTREGLGPGTLADLRFDGSGRCIETFVLNHPPWDRAVILVVGDNFGCGSSREHAVWGLFELGIRAILGTTFAGIFFGNCRRNGVLCVELPGETRDRLYRLASDRESCTMTVDLPAQRILTRDGEIAFDIEPSVKRDLMAGDDPIEATLASLPDIERYEAAHPPRIMLAGLKR